MNFRSALVLCTLLMGPGLLQAQERFRLADPQALSAAGSGWSVDPRTGALGMVLPVATAGLEIPIPISLRVSGQFQAQSVKNYQYLPDQYNRPRWIQTGTSNAVRPVHATVPMGSIAPATRFDGPTDSEIIILEDGAQFRSGDLVPFTDWNATFTLPQDFGFPAVAPSAVQVTTLGSHALYPTTAANLGTTWGSRILALAPAGYGAIPDAYRLLMDKDRARVFMQLPNHGPWVPVLWVDRFGHWVELKWQKDEQNLPAGVTAKYSLTVKNQRSQGVSLQWADFTVQDAEQDLLCAKLFGMGPQAVSILVKGYPGVSSLRPEGAPFEDPTITLVAGRGAGPIGRPTLVQIGAVPVETWPVWAAPAPGDPLPMAPPPSGQVLPLRSWSFGWDANHSAISTMTDALGAQTTFTYSAQTIPTTQTIPITGSVESTDPEGVIRCQDYLGDLSVWGVSRADAHDPRSGKTLSRTWTPETLGTGEPAVAIRERFGDPATAPRWTQLVFAKSTDDSGRDYGNGALKESRLWESGQSSPSASTVYSLRGAGLNRSYSARSGMVVTRQGEPTRTVASSLDPLGLYETAQTHFVGASPLKVQETLITPESLKDKLISGRPTQVTVTRFAPSGSAISPALVTKTEYDAKGLPSKQYRPVGAGQQGTSYSFDEEGRISFQIPISDIPFTSNPFTSFGYDPATGLLSSQTNVYRPAGPILTRSFSNFDGAGRPQTLKDERGLITGQQFDLLGRMTNFTPPAGEPTTLSYPDPWTRIITRGSAITTEHMDGFGRMIARDLPDGSGEEISYDEFGRQDSRIVISSGAAKQRRNKAQTLYDALDRPTTINSPGGASQGLAYAVDPAYPRWSLVTRTLNTPVTISSSQEYRDGLGQGIRQVSPKGDITESVFDGSGALTKVTLTPAGNGTPQIREFKYDDAGRMIQRSEPETGTTLFSDFNSLGQPTTITEAEGRVRTLAYDGLGRMVRMSSGGERISYAFSGLNLISASSVTNGVTVGQRFEYNGPAQQLSLEETTQPGLLNQISYGYDPATAHMNAIIYPGGRVIRYTRDALGRIRSITQNGSPVVTGVDFDEWGNRSRIAFASGAYSDWKAKDFGVHLEQWNIRYVAANGTATALDGTRFYQYDSAERLSMAGDWDDLKHDVQGRLTVANSSTLSLGTTHAHDAYGNNTAHSVSGAGLGALPPNALNSFAFNPMPDNRIPGMQANGTSISGWAYNGRGEATSVGVGTGITQSLGLAWDGLGRLKAVAYGGGTQSYLYAPSGMRVALMESASPTGTRRYAYTGGGLLLSEFGDAPVAGLMATLAAGTASPTKSKLKLKTKKTPGGLNYLLPPGDGGDGGMDPVPAGAWIVQPGGPTTVIVGQGVTFVGGTASGTALNWTFGDGATASGLSSSHAFGTAGTYTVTFKAARLSFLTSTATVQITVVPATWVVIGSFKSSAGTIAEGGYADLSWSVSNATSLSLTGAGAVPAVGTARVWPTTSTPYVLTATGPGGTTSSTVQVTVVAAPLIRVFVSEPAQVQIGQAATLRWTVDKATSYSLDQGIGAVPGTWATVWPGVSTTFTLTATNTQNGVSVTRTASTTLSVGEASSTVWKRDVIYLGSEAIAEIDAAGVHELHNDHLGSPTIITNGSSGQIEGKQVFGPYGERVKSEGYLPLTSYTGHVQQDATGLIYMRGRFYSPAWHRFVNSDQGVDPNSWNQMAYVGGSPFMATDPSGMLLAVISCGGVYQFSVEVSSVEEGNRIAVAHCTGGGGGAQVEVIGDGGGSILTGPGDPPLPELLSLLNTRAGGFGGQTPPSPQKSYSECIARCGGKEAAEKGVERAAAVNPISSAVVLIYQIGSDVYDAYKTGESEVVSSIDNTGRTIGMAYGQKLISNNGIMRGMKSVFSQQTGYKLGKTVIKKAPIVGVAIGLVSSGVSIHNCVKDCMAGK